MARAPGTLRFDLLDRFGSPLPSGEVRSARPVTITHNTASAAMRQVTGMEIPARYAARVDPFTMRVRGSWVYDDGSTVPLITGVFTAAPGHRHTYGTDLFVNIADYGALLDRSDGRFVFYPPGMPVHEAIEAELRDAGLPDPVVDGGLWTVGGVGKSWPIGTKVGQRVGDLVSLGGFLPVYFDGDGTPRVRIAPDLTVAAPRFDYDAPPLRIVRGSPIAEDTRYGAFNRWIVVSAGGTEVPMVGHYDVPASVPWSYEATGIRNAAPVANLPGISSEAQANAIAKALAANDPSLIVRREFDSLPDPRHSTFDVIRLEQTTWLESAWTLNGVPKGVQHHSVRRTMAA